MKYIKDYDETFSSQLLDFLGKNINNNFIGGVFSSDDLKNVKKGKFYIINTDKSTGSGEHWSALFCDVYGNTLFYDSFNRDSKKLFPDYYKKFNLIDYKIPFEYTQKQIQQNCGSYVCAWVIYILYNNITNV